MPNDPHSRRTRPAPAHPSGLRPSDDGPAFLAPAVDVRPASPARSVAPRAPGAEASGTEVPFTLSRPVEVREPSVRPPPEVDEHAPGSQPPETVDWERGGRVLGGAPGSGMAPGSVPAVASLPPVVSLPPLGSVPPRGWVPAGGAPALEAQDDEAESAALIRDLQAIAALDERPDRAIERAVVQRTTLARARALRFRLALLRAWPAHATAPAHGPQDGRSFQLDLAIDAMLLVALADGAPSRSGPASPLPVVDVMVESIRPRRPDLARRVLRDRGAAAIARWTIVGWKAALEAVAKAALALPVDARVLALELAARAALRADGARSLDPHRLGASTTSSGGSRSRPARWPRRSRLPGGPRSMAVERAR
jgi:hypothetical protein